MRPAQVFEFYRRLAGQNPEPRSELDYRDPFTLLVAVVLSAQATDKGVNKATPRLFAKAPTPEKMVKLGLGGITECIKSIGLFNSKASNILELSRLLIERHQSQVPGDRASLEALPGVGRKTASVVLNIAFGQPVIAVDTHILRTANRTGLARGRTPDAVAAKLEKITPLEFKRHAHHWLILHGRYTCKARAPKCAACLVRDLCAWKEKAPAS